jgi:hypothetical protein
MAQKDRFFTWISWFRSALPGSSVCPPPQSPHVPGVSQGTSGVPTPTACRYKKTPLSF